MYFIHEALKFHQKQSSEAVCRYIIEYVYEACVSPEVQQHSSPDAIEWEHCHSLVPRFTSSSGNEATIILTGRLPVPTGHVPSVNCPC